MNIKSSERLFLNSEKLFKGYVQIKITQLFNKLTDFYQFKPYINEKLF